MSPPSFRGPSKVNAAKRTPHQKKTGMCYPAHTRLKELEFFAPKPLLQTPIPRRQKLEPQRVELEPHRAGDMLLAAVDRRLQHLALGAEPEPVIDQLRIARHQAVLEMARA